MSDSSLYPKEFIKHIFIRNLDEIVNKHGYHYISFGIIGVGIEFLGKCIREKENHTWHEERESTDNFNGAIDELMKNYIPYKDSYMLCKNLRHGFAHAFQPRGTLELTHKKEALDRNWKHCEENERGRLVLVCEELYKDFNSACNHVVEMKFPKDSKMNRDFIDV